MNSNEKKETEIRSIEELITALMLADQNLYDSIVRSIRIPYSMFYDYCSWSNETYTRNCIEENEKFELILLCWNGKQKTPIHNHGGEECWVKVIEGTFKENIYTTEKNGKLKMIKSIDSKPNDVTYMIDFMGFHSIENLSTERGMSLHLYAKPIRRCKIYDENIEEFVNKELTYHSIK